ncbi:MAG: sensor histidine kinase, partial [Terriglobia bacterium]
LGLLAGGVAHDFNNLLTVIVNCATFLSEALEEDDPNRHDVTQILAAADRGEALVAQLLSLTRRKPAQPRSVNLGEVVAEFAGLLRRTLPAGIETEIVVAPDLWPALVDRGRLEQVLMNLAVNARDAMAHGGRLTIALSNEVLSQATSLRPEGDYISIRVSDSGTGIKPEIIQNIFDPFFTTKGQREGSGLGLTVARRIIRKFGGDIRIESQEASGTSCIVTLPVIAPLPPPQEASCTESRSHSTP